MKKAVIFILSLFLLIGCGYKPSAYFAKNVLGKKVYIHVTMSREDPQNTVSIKDAVSSAFIDKFGSQIVTKEFADTQLFVTLQSVNFRPLVYDKNGYVISYKATAKLQIDYNLFSGEKGTVITSGDYDFPIAADSIISDTKRFEAIKYASEDAIDEFTASITLKGLQYDGNK
ncbi:MAG: LPS assembly lipoprotein LptE [Campylobacteraceae bacterium]|jgi:uncharacterized protein YcfL|nr:LPS assembly lipoprotein LptE [Campylobacteraceae bacterium]